MACFFAGRNAGGAICFICRYFYRLDWFCCYLASGILLVKTDYSGVYYTEQVDALIGSESLQGSTDTELSSEGVPGDGNPVLVDKYNYLKIENVFQGRLLDSKELFSFEVAVATFQTNVTADFFYKSNL